MTEEYSEKPSTFTASTCVTSYPSTFSRRFEKVWPQSTQLYRFFYHSLGTNLSITIFMERLTMRSTTLDGMAVLSLKQLPNKSDLCVYSRLNISDDWPMTIFNFSPNPLPMLHWYCITTKNIPRRKENGEQNNPALLL